MLITLLSSSLFYSQNQNYSFSNYDWNENEKGIQIEDQYKNENEVILERNVKIELSLVDKLAKQYYLIHEKTFINSNDAIERNNKIYLPFSKNEVVLNNKARVILKNGKIITLNKSDIKEEVDEQRGVKYNYFAVNGLEKGAVIETIFVLEETPNLDGKSIRMQDRYPIAKLNFELIYPEHLTFKTKSYNGVGEPSLDTTKVANKIVLSINEKNIIGLDDDEKYSNWNAALKLFRYKLDSNYLSKAKNLYNFKEFATSFYDRFNVAPDKKEQKAIDALCKSIPKSNDPEEQIWNIENKIKKTIIYDRFSPSKQHLAEIITTKQANQRDILKLYIAVLRNFNIENNVVFTSDRYKLVFDKDFESYENLSDILFYFPTINKYITPTDLEYRIPLIPADLANNYGLFVKEKTFGGMKTGIGEINFINIPGADVTHDEANITVDFTKDIENPLITSKMSYGGYSALNFQPLKDFVSADEYKTMLKSIANNYTLETDYKELSAENEGLDNIGKKPFILNVTFEGKDLIQKAGDNYLFSVGQIIGRQMELYQEHKRQLPIVINYPHSYIRRIKILLPKGTTVKNLDKFNMDHTTIVNGKTEAIFKSNFTQNGDEILVTNDESYTLPEYPLDSFESYKAVINAAADFNKIVIILQKS